jgi:hypothetical protein
MATRALNATVLTLAALALTTRLEAQDTRIDRFGAGWARLDTICAVITPPSETGLTDRLRQLPNFNSPAAPDSIKRKAGCLLALLYAHQSELWNRIKDWQDEGGPAALTYFTAVLADTATDVTAGNALAALALDLSVATPLKIITGYRQQVADAMYAAVHAGNESPIVLRACTRFNLVVGDLATARYCSAKALREGADSSWHLIRWSWLASLHHDSTNAARLMQLAIARAHDSASSGEVHWFLAKVSAHYKDTMTPADSAAAFAHGLKDAEAEPDFLGDLYAQCPIWLVEHGSHSRSAQDDCTHAYGNPDVPIATVGHLFRLWSPTTQAPIALVAYSVPRSDIDLAARDQPTVVHVDLDLRQWDWASGGWSDTTAQHQRLVPGPVGKTSYFSGAFVTTPTPGPNSWSLVVTQYGRYGRTSVDGTVPLATGPLVLSDLVAGVRSQGLTWTLGRDTVVLAPLGTVSPHEPMTLFYQIRNMGPARTLISSVVLRHISHGRIEPNPVITIHFRTDVGAGLTSVERDLDLSRIRSDDYHLTVQLLGTHGAVLAEREADLLVH